MKRKISVSKVVTVTMAMMVLTMALTSGINASSVNKPYSYNLSKQEGFKTNFRNKANDSSVYMNCQTASNSYIAAVYGGFENAGAYDCSRGLHYKFKQGYKRFMYNFVKENGYTVAGVFAISGTGTATGLWSPDSVAEAGVKPATDYIKN